jgi:hypothetical protein
MTQQVIFTGTQPNDTTGDPLQLAFNKCNSNFTELYADSSVLLAKSKTAATSRNTLTVVAPDPDLQLSLPIGVFAIAMNIGLQSLTAGAGFKFNFNFTGTLTSSNYDYSGSINGAAVSSSATFITATSTFATLSTTAIDWLQITGFIIPTVAGILQFQWAQNASQAANTSVGIGSWMSLTKVG